MAVNDYISGISGLKHSVEIRTEEVYDLFTT